jgi:RNA polymerase sigma-70 factor (sigma-E family)
VANLGEESFRAFVARRQRALLRTAYLLTGDWGTAEDLLQTALTKTYLARHRIRDESAVEAYVRTTMATTSISWWRRRWHGERATGVLPERPAANDGPAEFDERDRIWQLVRSLPPRQRAVLVLRYYEDLTEADTADLLRISVGTVKSQTSRAMQTLREALGERNQIEEATP